MKIHVVYCLVIVMYYNVSSPCDVLFEHYLQAVTSK